MKACAHNRAMLVEQGAHIAGSKLITLSCVQRSHRLAKLILRLNLHRSHCV
jgi:hypothetical protein